MGKKKMHTCVPEWTDHFTANKNDFQFQSFQVSALTPYINWPAGRWAGNAKQPTGIIISFLFTSEMTSLKDLIIKVNYELYDGIPLIVKWLSVENKSSRDGYHQ